MMKRLETRLRQQRRDDAQPTVVTIEFDSAAGVTAERAYAAACASGHVPENAALLLIPRRLTHAEWNERIKRRQQPNLAVKPAGASTGADTPHAPQS